MEERLENLKFDVTYPTGSRRRYIEARGVLKALRLAVIALSDELRRLLGMQPTYIKLVGNRNDLCLLELEESELSRGHTPVRQVRLQGYQIFELN